MAIIGLQRAGTQTGRIRIGQKIVGANGKERPVKLDTFRFTTASLASAHDVAAVFGGTVRPWEGNQYEVVTEADSIGVTVPPRDAVINQHMEMWTSGAVVRRCDRVTAKTADAPTGTPCLCPADDLERAAAAAKGRACKPVTRLNVMIPNLRGFGVWRLDTGGYYAAVELADIAELMQAARDRGIALPAILRIDQRERQILKPGIDPKTKKQNRDVLRYGVPVLEPLVSYSQLVRGELDHLDRAALLPPAPGEPLRAIGGTAPVRAAIESSPAAAPAVRVAEASPASPPTRTAAPTAAVRVEPNPPAERYDTPQAVADAAAAARDRGQLRPLFDVAEQCAWRDMNVEVDPGAVNPADAYADLGPYLSRRWAELPPPGPADNEDAGTPPEPPHDDW